MFINFSILREKVEIKMQNIKKLLCCFLILSSALAQEAGICPPSTLTADLSYDNDWLIEYAPQGPIDPGECVDVIILKGCPPYSWSVSENDGDGETDFSYDPDETGAVNTICLSQAACGSAFITVTDSCDSQISGSVRSTAGKWYPGGDHNDWETVAEVRDSDMGCPGGGATYHDHASPCDGISAAYVYRVTQYINGQSIICIRPFCKEGADCTGRGTSCYFEISDGICSYAWKLNNRCGASLLQLQRREWICH
jgi:hypothetical protein